HREAAHAQHRVAGHAEALVVVHVDPLRAQLPRPLVGVAGAVGRVVHLPDRAAHGDRVGAAVAAAVDQLVADVGDDVAVVVLAALGAVGDDADAGVLVAHVALGHVAPALGVEAQLVGAEELVAADQGAVALARRGGPRAAALLP